MSLPPRHLCCRAISSHICKCACACRKGGRSLLIFRTGPALHKGKGLGEGFLHMACGPCTKGPKSCVTGPALQKGKGLGEGSHGIWALQKGLISCGKPCRRAVASPAEGQKGFPAKMGSRMWMSSHPSIQESHFLNSLSWISAMRPKSPCQSDDWTTKRVEGGWIELVDSVRLCHACAIHST